jgi:uncharacterized SAM-binding protein YcdF (DUF218 family)
VVYVLAALGLLQVLIVATPLTEWWTRALAGDWTDPSGTTLVVFGSEVQGEGTIGEVSYWRTVYAVRAWREGAFQHMILCGGPAVNPVSQAMREFVVSQGVDASRVLVDRTSRNTRENALEAKRLVSLVDPQDLIAKDALAGDDPLAGHIPKNTGVVLLTSDYHMFRAIRAVRKVGLRARPRPIPDMLKRTSVWYRRWDVFLVLSAETSKIVYYWARGWI